MRMPIMIRDHVNLLGRLYLVGHICHLQYLAFIQGIECTRKISVLPVHALRRH